MHRRSHLTRRSQREPDAIAFARDQRARANEFANAVWQIVRNRGCRNQQFRREFPIPPYTADFCCVALKLIVEVDGEHHQTEEGREADETSRPVSGRKRIRRASHPGKPGVARSNGCAVSDRERDRRTHGAARPPHPRPLSPSKLRERGDRVGFLARRIIATHRSCIIRLLEAHGGTRIGACEPKTPPRPRIITSSWRLVHNMNAPCRTSINDCGWLVLHWTLR